MGGKGGERSIYLKKEPGRIEIGPLPYRVCATPRRSDHLRDPVYDLQGPGTVYGGVPSGQGEHLRDWIATSPVSGVYSQRQRPSQI